MNYKDICKFMRKDWRRRRRNRQFELLKQRSPWKTKGKNSPAHKEEEKVKGKTIEEVKIMVAVVIEKTHVTSLMKVKPTITKLEIKEVVITRKEEGEGMANLIINVWQI